MSTKRRAIEAGIVAAVLVIAVVLYTLFATPALSVRKDGTYITAMDSLRLYYLDPADAERDVVYQFGYNRYDMGALLSLTEPGVAYPAALVRLVTQPFGLNFDTRLLACVYALIMGVGAGLMVSGLYRHSTLAALSSGAMLLMLCTFTPAMGYLNSLYEMGAVVALLVLYLGAVVSCLCKPKGCGSLPAMLAMLTGAMFLRAQAQLIVLAPAMLVIAVICILHAMPEATRRATHLLCCGLVLFWCTQGVTAGYATSPVVQSDAANYLAVFQGYLPVSEDVQADLEALGLPAECAADVGRSYYEAEENFAVNPRDLNNQETLLDHIGLGERAWFCITHPGHVVRMIQDKFNHFYDAYNDRIVTTDGQGRFVRPSPLVLIDLLLPFAGSGTLMCYMLGAAAALLACLLIVPKKTGLGKLAIGLALLCLGMAAYLPAAMVQIGPPDIYMMKVPVFFFAWFAFFALVVAGLCLGDRLLQWLSDQHCALRPAGETASAGNARLQGLAASLQRIPVTRRGLLCVCAAICILVGVWLLGPETHVGGVNNGDYGRMMAQIKIDWTPEMMTDYENQAGLHVIEEYVFRDDFDARSLLSLDPSYSLAYPTAILRAWNALTGALFSTRNVAIMLFVITSLCILLVVRDLYPLLGKLTILPAAVLIAMLLGENYIAWYNALFGESMVSTGLIMTLACSVHLMMMPRGSRKSWLWLLLLAVSIRMMTCAKAQMALALPGGLLLLIGLAIYHHPKGAVKLTAFALAIALFCGIVSYDTLAVYAKNDDVSARHTVWQSVFFGALMIAEDPDAAMAELGIDPAMKPDIGKHAYYPDEDYVYAPLSEEAQRGFYDQVNTFTMVGYYLKHPLDFLYMLNRAASESVELHTGFMCYTDETYPEHTDLERFTLWMNLRPLTACRAFWQYVVVYGIALIIALRVLCKKDTPARNRLFALLFLAIMCIGVFQYPLSVVGNGFADNNKQLYCFMLCHDLLVIFAFTTALHRFNTRTPKQKGVMTNA